jgi:ATP-dependent DNA helicase RecQ
VDGPSTPELRAHAQDDSAGSLDEALKHQFGYDGFRPLQREIIETVLSGRDALALLPTGAGKSLCYQLPAVVRPGLTLVISPLIALMKDQVDALRSSGIAATYLNSTLDAQESSERIRALNRGEYRLLYAAPERAVQPGFVNALQRWSLERIAVDEAHCVSEWGHDFRPEYRRIHMLRERFPATIMLALTATATQRVRDDIVRYLELRDPQCFVGSFDRPNLRYVVFEKRDPFKQLLAWCTARSAESGIVYVQSRQSAEDLAARLTAAGVTALPYHAGLDARERARNQELFVRDEIRVICATIAFGMGIDKPNVRYVVHFDVPKNLEGYYQETGRAGRDGLRSECALFFSGGDAMKQRHFIRKIEDEAEREQAERLLRHMLDFAASVQCRRGFLLRYFDEMPKSENCGNCDNCLRPPQRIDGTTAARKLLSCVYRIRERGGFTTGAHHLIDVLLGKTTEKVRSWRHDRLSTFAIGREHTKSEWLALVSELLRIGWIEERDHRTLALTADGVQALRERRPVSFAKSRFADRTPKRKSTAPPVCDESYDASLFEELRRLRKQIADGQGVPPYVVFSDATLRELAVRKPATLTAFREISGVGDVKLERYGESFTAAIATYVGQEA